MKQDRKTVLLRACYDMLKKCDQSHYTISPMETTVFYDEADCDGGCLMDDIAIELDLPRNLGRISAFNRH